MKIFQICAYAAPYEGNFMHSLFALERALKDLGYDFIYAFPEGAKDIKWCQEIMRRTKVYFLPLAKAQINPQTYLILKKIHKDNKDIVVIHSHFEQYDTPAVLTAPKGVRVFWHLHNPVTFSWSLRGIFMLFQYGIISHYAFLLSVAEKYRNDLISLGFPVSRTSTILNGIDLQRIRLLPSNRENIKYDFLTFAWDFYRKGGDLILAACKRLANDGYQFRLLFNGCETTWKYLDEYYAKCWPEYIHKSDPALDVNQLFSEAGCFISASRRETFSYSVCEAAYAGLPVICSDIPGLEWAKELPTIDFFESENEDDLYQRMKKYLTKKVTMTMPDGLDDTRMIIKEKYSVQSWVQNIISAYKLG